MFVTAGRGNRPPARCYDLVRHHRANDRIFLYAFDLIELNGDDLRPIRLRAERQPLR